MNDENVNVTVDGNRRNSRNYNSNNNSTRTRTRTRTLFLLPICSLIVCMILYAILYNNKEYLLIMMSPTTTTVVRPSTITTTTTTVLTVDEAAAVIEATNTTITTTTGVDSSNTNNSNIKLIRDTALHYQTTTKSTNNQNTNTQNKKNELFINTFADCVLDPNCHLLYHHVGKTGGTTIEKIFYTLFPKIKKPSSGGGSKQRTSCCFSDMLKRFQQDPYHYCLQQKFSAYQVRGKQFETIVLQCLDLIKNSTTTKTDDDNDDDIIISSTKNKNKNKYKNKSTKKRRQRQRIRFLTFSTYREPIARTISDIHQLCNKNLNRRTKQLQEVCQRCTYDNTNDTVNNTDGGGTVINDKVYWNKLIHNTNRIYRHLDYLNKHLLRHSHYRQSQNQNQNTATTTNTNTSNNSNNNNININIDSPSPIVIDYLMIDVIDIDDFLHRLDQSLVLKQQQQQQQQQQSQKQKQTPSSSSSSSSSNTKIIRIPYLNNDNNKNSGHGHGHVIKSNQESIKFCNFGKQIRIIADDTQTSTSTSTSSTVELEIIELLQTSIDIYNNFTTN